MSTAVNIADRWHKSRPRPGDEPCKCGRGKTRLYPKAEHGQGDRWQVQWRSPDGKQHSANRPKKEGADPDVSADAYADEIRASLRGPYVDPKLKEGTFAAFAEKWRKTRSHDTETAGNLERRLRLHVFEDPERPGEGRTPRGGPALGHLTWAQLDQFTSLTQAWITGLTAASGSNLSPDTARLVVGDVSSVFTAAMEDHLIGRDPTHSKAVTRPKRSPRRARAWTEEETVVMEAALPARFAIVQRIGPSVGTRLGELAGLSVDDVDFLKPKGEKEIRIGVQVKPVGHRLVFAPLKNRKVHSVPVDDGLVEDISAHLAKFPAVPVTLPWHDLQDKEKHGKPVTRRLIVTNYQGGAIDTARWDRDVWKTALAAAGLIPPKEDGRYARSRERGTHAAWRHTAASQWLADGVDPAGVAEWLGDSVKVVVDTYLHMMPSAPGRGRAAMAAHRERLEAARSRDRASARNVPGQGTG